MKSTLKKKSAITNEDFLCTIYSSDFNIFLDSNKYKSQLNRDNLIIKSIIGDGNCFYRAISYFYHQTQNFHKNIEI